MAAVALRSFSLSLSLSRDPSSGSSENQCLTLVLPLETVCCLTSCAGMTCHARRGISHPKIAIFSQFQAYLSIIQAKIINLSLLNNISSDIV